MEFFMRDCPGVADNRLVVVVLNSGFPATPCVEVKDVGFGFDWDAGKIMLYTEPSVMRPSRTEESAPTASNIANLQWPSYKEWLAALQTELNGKADLPESTMAAMKYAYHTSRFLFKKLVHSKCC
jgi:hypothetical protein